jgi:hypothetical protein
VAPKIESDDPNRAKDRSDREEPKWANPITENVDAKRETLLSDTELPMFAKSKTAKDDPNRATPNTAIDEPKRDMLRIDMVLPSCK